MADKDVDYDALGQVFQTTFGKSSTAVVSGYSVIFSFGPGGTLLAKFNALVNFGNEGEMVRTKRRYEDDAQRVIKLHLDRLKKDYKELTGDSISFSEVAVENNLEMLASAFVNPRRTAMFKSIVTLEIN